MYFHKESSFVSSRSNGTKDTNFWIIRKDNNISTIHPYGMKNPVKTSYEMMWNEIKENQNISEVTIQNTMRRILENYFNILGADKDSSIINSFKTNEEKIICRSLLSWINDGSHIISDDLYIDSYTDSVERYKKIFKEIFANTGNIAHYNMMMGEKNNCEDHI